MRILALDASLAQCSAALWQDGVVLAERVVAGDRGHAASLPPLAAAVLAEAGLAAAAVDALAAVIGPGSFTGIRTALALAEGLALATGRPLIGVTTGEALRAALPAADRAGPVWAGIDNRRGRVVLERFGPDAPPVALALDDLPPAPPGLVLVGDAAPQLLAALAARGGAARLGGVALPCAGAAASVAAARLAGTLPPCPARPLYVEPPAVRPPA
jgi:tRNA threonylcarbamoyladenosine biosynthesis protein TsaB